MAAATIAEETAAAIADAVAAGVAVAEEDGLAEDARKAAQVADAISRPQNTRRRRAANPAGTTIAEASHVGSTIGARILRAVRTQLPRRTQRKSRFFFQANRSQNTAASPQRRQRRHRWSSMKFMNRSARQRRALHERLVT